jgi:inorganic pyrophosphatase|uniref:inorganic diphosphatase n=1 Tax=viral metagenome TaxID=1070528 RepID=A0A6C0ISY0_9ZZZZ
MLARIEISKNSNIKYEFDEKNNSLVLDRILPNSNTFPYNYGYIPDTLAPDGDPVDIILLSSHQLIPGCIIKIRVIGGIETTDEQGQDDKIICVLDEKLDKENNHIKNIDDVTEVMLNNIIYFLNHYKDNDGDKFIHVGQVYNKEKAIQFIDKCKT